MRSDCTNLAKCGEESAYFCQMRGKTTCGHLWPNCKYKLHTLVKPLDKNEIHPLTLRLSSLFIAALAENLENVAWCIDLAQTALTYELIAKAEGKPELFVQNKIREKIEKDKGVLIR